jgi:solute:Na+ symporter, SSS family
MMAAAVIAHTSAILNSSVALYSMDFHEKFIAPIARPWRIAAIASVILTITSILMVPIFQNAESIINLLQQLNGLFSMPILSAFIAGLLFRNVDARAAIGGLVWGLGSYAIHNFVLYVPNAAFDGQTYYQAWGMPGLHYIDVMVIVLITSVIVALIINRLVFGNRATFIFSAEGREMRRLENAALDATEARA